MAHRLFHIELPIQPGWEAIEPFRAAALACVEAIFPKHAVAPGVALVVAELLENAVKFGRWEARGEGYFAIRIDGHEDRVEILVSNPVDPSSEHVGRLAAEIERIAAAPSPEEAYAKAVRAVALGKRSSLGLLRAAHEGGCDLSLEIAGPVVHVRGVTRRLGPAPPTPAAPR